MSYSHTMNDFNLKTWLDKQAVPLLGHDLMMHSVLQNQPSASAQPESILVWLLAKEPTGWAPALKRLLEQHDFVFDFLRAPQLVGRDPTRGVTIFGGDGAPFINKSGAAMARLFRRCDAIDLIVEIGYRFPTATAAAAAVKAFFAQFETAGPFDVIEKYKPRFGIA